MRAGTRVLAIGSADLVLGLGLLGIDGVEAGDDHETREALEKALADPGTALVLIDETCAEGVRAILEASAREGGRALVVEVPSATGPGAAASLHDRLEQTLGFQLGD